MRRTVLVVLALLGVLAVLAGCGSGPQTPTDRVAATHELRVCSTGDYRPLTYRDASGSWSGIDVDLARDLAAHLGAQVTMVPTTWSTMLDDVTAQRCDIAVGGVSVTADRAARAAFTVPYLHDGKTPIVRCADLGRYSTLEQIDRPGVRAVVNPGGTNERFARGRLHAATIVPYPDNNTIHDTVADGRTDLMITDAIEARWQAAARPGVLCAEHPDAPFDSSEKAYLIPAGDQAFVDRVDGWLTTALADGTWDRVARPWLG
ncbi:transporter substrate-binding domain-containing protein [Actinomycetospora termitidis]|uniref:Transporter substrate-binding domain-containing protein n=1 Tax=Actinomycetospora termitidis TaxID=3053470 RepID=A0ABT7MBB0_9PSEU|nr:transporter substrate-binding domain-containing protein [Actinomycetospora sp. Odt1-22]MDL5156703.1 transporter substrate-binding domain-containing protein [Actinomycetospora sp. Odt1-22]